MSEPDILSPAYDDDGRRMPCGDCKSLECCERCLADIEAAALRLALKQGRQGRLFD